ncbi:uncharacterized protein VTP21DRAFT_11653 [Calcarisporiella thermophila]|uniref:uncharacterized protein n=1 Tax=Calcarisporiella thermophila TaxID=911321 RepID=UPI00374448A5
MSVQEPLNVTEPPANTNEYVTVFDDPKRFNAKHKLQNSWTLWFDNPGKKASTASWSQNLRELITFSTVEDFWCVYNNVAKASEIGIGSNYHLFKKDIKPMWEDAANEKGGKWSIQFPRNRTGEEINNYWLYTVLACIGEAFDADDEICGAVVSVRKIFYRISLWTRTSNNREVTEKIGRQLKETLNIPPNNILEFQSHSDAQKSGPHGKDRLTV